MKTYEKITLKTKDKTNLGAFICTNGSEEGKEVLLFLHGGPGFPAAALDNYYKSRLEEVFNVVWFEQRGSGLSYKFGMRPESLSVELMVEDVIFITRYLQERFRKEKIFIMGHSFGSILGMYAIKKHPELYEAYIGVGQITQIAESEEKMYFEMKKDLLGIDDKFISKLDKYNIDSKTINMKYLSSVRNTALTKARGGTTRARHDLKYVLKDVLKFSGYNIFEKIKFFVGASFSFKAMVSKIYFLDLRNEVKEVDVPIYLFHGFHDRQVSLELTKKYFDEIKAPKKEMYIFEKSAHSPIFEEQEKVLQIIKEEIISKSKV